MSAYKVALLQGGSSLERQVSLRSGARVEDALNSLGHTVEAIDVGPDLVPRLEKLGPDVVFIALHGRGGEDGTVQELLEILGLPYTGCGVLAAFRTWDKVLTKLLLQQETIPTPDFVAFSETAFREFGAAKALPAIERRLEFPLVVKPARQGSALGIKFADSAEAVPAALVSAFSYDDRVLLERHITGRELAVSLIDGEALPVVEALPLEGSYFDFESRYNIGQTSYVCPADLSNDLTKSVQNLAQTVYELLGCYGFARVDIILAEDDTPYVLEVNAIPGLTETSLMPQAAEAAGISFEDLVRRMIDSAIIRQNPAV